MVACAMKWNKHLLTWKTASASSSIAERGVPRLLLLSALLGCAADDVGPKTDSDTDSDTDVDTDTDTSPLPTPLSQADGKLLGEHAGDVAGDKVFAAGDVNQDGLGDLIVGARKFDATGSESGIAYVLLGPLSGINSLSSAVARLEGESAGDFAGGSVASAGDVDNDGFDDVLVGAKLQDHGTGIRKGTAYLVHGPLEGTLDLADADARFDGENAADTAGGTVRGLGDINEDGFDDIAIAAKSSDTHGVDAGAIYLFQGPLTGTYRLGLDETARLLGEESGDQAGGTLGAPGDVNGDGLADLVTCGCLNDGSALDAGVVYVVHAPFSGDIDLGGADARWNGENAGDAVGFTAGIGDLTGDGLPDIGIGSPLGGDGGTFYVVEGTQTGSASLSESWLRGVGSPGDQAGGSLSRAGDVDGDGRPDLVVGAAGHDNGTGWVGVFFGPVQGVLSMDEADQRYLGETAGDVAGLEVSGGMDLDGDNLGDLAIGAPGNDQSAPDAGAVYLVLGFDS